MKMENIGNAILIIGSFALAIIYKDSISLLEWILLALCFVWGLLTWKITDSEINRLTKEKMKKEIEYLVLKIERLRRVTK